MFSLAQNWRNIYSGDKNWGGLIDPIDINLRRCIIHCGERAQAIIDAFNRNKFSKGYGLSSYPKEEFFSKVGLETGNLYKYELCNFVYARSEIKISDWVVEGETSLIGYVAVATNEGKAVVGRRDILICWRGTVTLLDWEQDADVLLVSASELFGEIGNNVYDVKVHKGFRNVYTAKHLNSTYSKTSARDQVIKEVRKLVDMYKDEELSITITGHSFGGAMAVLNAVDIVSNGHNKPTSQPETAIPVTAIVFGSPKVGNQGFKNMSDELKQFHILRIENSHDPVPKLPLIGYAHVGQQLEIDTTKLPFLKHGMDLRTVHNLEVYLHGIAGMQGREKEFELGIERDVSLVNKHLDCLKDEYSIPVKWWVQENHGMIQMDDGSWILDDYLPDPPSP